MNQPDSLILALLNGLLNRPEAVRFELRGEELLADDVPLIIDQPSSERLAAARIGFLAHQAGCPGADPRHLTLAWHTALVSQGAQTRGELFEIARGLGAHDGGDPVDRWAATFRQYLDPTLESIAWVEAFEPGTDQEVRESHLELRPLLDRWPRRILTDRSWAFVETPLPRMAPLPLDEVWVDLEIVDFAMTADLPPESSLAARLDRRYEARRWRAESVELVLDRLRGSAALIGAPGSGKTTLLRWLARHLITHPEGRFLLPLFVPLRAYALWSQSRGTSASLLDFAIEQCGIREARQRDLWLNTLSYLAGSEREHILLLLDGWDEVPPEHREVLRAEIDDLLHGFSMLITSRPSAYPRGLPTTHFYEISELAPESVEILSRRWLGIEDGEGGDTAAPVRFLEHLERYADLRRMARNPFLLTLLCGLFQEGVSGTSPAGGGDLPVSRSELYDRALRLIYAHHDQRRPAARLDAGRRRQIESLALWLLGDAPRAPRYVFDSQDVADAIGDDELLERYLQPARLLDQWDAEAGTHHFLHATFQEYLAAKALASESIPALARRLEAHLHDPGWQNVLHFLAGQPGSAHSLFWRRMARLARHPDRFGLVWTRLSRFVAETGASDGGKRLLGIDLREALWRCIRDTPLDDLSLLSPYVEAFAALDRSGLVERLRAASTDKSPLASRFARALVQIQGPASSAHLVDVILGAAPGDLERALANLNRHLDDAGYRRLRSIARDGDTGWAIRQRAILALGQARDTASVSWLVELARVALPTRSLQAGDGDSLAAVIARSLGLMGGDDAVHGLTTMLSWSSRSAWQRAVIHNLGAIHSRAARDALLTALALRTPEDDVYRAILVELRGKPIYRGREMLLDLLTSDADEGTRADAVLALRQTSGFGVVQAIVDAARRDPSERVRRAAVLALERRARPVDVSWLGERFTAGDLTIPERQGALRAVLFAASRFAGGAEGRQLEATAGRLVRMALELDPSLARDAAQHAHLAGAAVGPVLLDACLKTALDSRARSAACLALGRLRHRPAIEALAGLVRETSSGESRLIAHAAARALAWIDIEALQDAPDELAVKALATHAVEHGYLIFDDVVIGPDGSFQAVTSVPDPDPKKADVAGADLVAAAPPGAAPPPHLADLEIHVEIVEVDRKPHLRFTLDSPNSIVPYTRQKILGPPFSIEPAAYQASLFAEVEELHHGSTLEGASLPEEEIVPELERIGRKLYDELFSWEMKTEYRFFRDKIESLYVVSYESSIPWELVKPYDDDPRALDSSGAIVDDRFWGERFQLTRWLHGRSVPAPSIRMRRLACVESGSAFGVDRLKEAHAECAAVKAMAQRHGVAVVEPAQERFTEVRELMATADVDLWHFAGHGELLSDPDEAGFLLADGRCLRPKDLEGKVRTRLQRNRPLVFLNACQLGRSALLRTRLGGWAARCLEAGCGAFVGPQWTVEDALARRFAESFYVALEGGATLAEAARGTRQEIGGMAMAFAIYAHPGGRLDWGSETDPRPDPGAEAVSTPLGQESISPLEPSISHDATGGRTSTAFSRFRETVDNFSQIALNEANWIAGEDEHDRRLGGPIKLESLYVRRHQEDDIARILLDGEKPNPIVLVKGIAGHGKTSLLWGLAHSLRDRIRRVIWFVKAEWLTYEDSSSDASADLLSADNLATAAQQLAHDGEAPIVLIDTVDLLMHHAGTRRRTLEWILRFQRAGAAVVLTSRIHEARLLHAGLDVTPILLGPYSEDSSDDEGRDSEMVRAVRAHAARFYHQADQIDLRRHVDEILEATDHRRALHDVCVNPLTLRMLFLLYAPDEVHSREINVYQLYLDFWQRRITRDLRGGSQLSERPGADLTQTAAAVALVMIAEGKPAIDRRFIASHLGYFQGRGEEIDALSTRGVLLDSPPLVRFFHQSFLEHAAAHGFLTLLKAQSGLHRLADRVVENPGNLFLTPVLEQALLLAAEQAELRQPFDAIMQRLLIKQQTRQASAEDSLLLAGLYVYAHASEVSEVSRQAVCELLDGGSPELVEDYLDLVPNIDLEHRGRKAVLIAELDLIWRRDKWPEQKKVLAVLHRFLPWFFESVRDLLERWDIITWASTQEGSQSAEQEVLDLLFPAVNHDSVWVLQHLADLYRQLETTRRKRTKGSQRILDFLDRNAERFDGAQLATTFERAIGLVGGGRPKTTLIEAWGRLWLTEWRQAGVAVENLYARVATHHDLALCGRLEGLALLVLEDDPRSVKATLDHVEGLTDFALRATWSRIAVARLLLGPRVEDETDVAPVVELARREIISRLRDALCESGVGPTSKDKIWIQALDSARLPATVWKREDLLLLSELPAEAWLGPDLRLRLLAPAAAAGVEEACRALSRVVDEPTSYGDLLQRLVTQLDEACREGLNLASYLERLALTAGLAEPLVGLAKRDELDQLERLDTARLQELITRASRARCKAERRSAYRLWRHAVKLEMLEPPSLRELENLLSNEASSDVAKSIVQLLEQGHRRAQYPRDRLWHLLSPPRFHDANDNLGETALRFLLRSFAEDSSPSIQLLRRAFSLALTSPINAERLGLMARILMPYRRTRAPQIASMVEQLLDSAEVSRLSPGNQYSVRSRFLIVARDAFGRLEIGQQRDLVRKVPQWTENLGGLIVDAATMTGAAEIWDDLEALCRNPQVSPKLKRIISDRRRLEEDFTASERWQELYELMGG